jgi:hypothetical protein
LFFSTLEESGHRKTQQTKEKQQQDKHVIQKTSSLGTRSFFFK